ncbi:MAG: anti-sigma factor antagonist [Pseudonocardiales bacterium]|jgi:anti-sigma B factor antagonist|uniref:STAS domain-containing protein n=1 Tax=Pseudonocardia sp. TaxID=60912 RepID=UPI0026078DCB|nr:STAS domain-containing protein [Pseudonocardia sp.]MCW2716618.1 anti-anti-sigma factor [Pseudonocardia sp.]MDT7615906.1 anti-sigma factor antagonist [Pseudonocardiales bacterium]MDT7706314.1 anti-sigma factor antagonist [Pseudonocardiales bacterium]
MSETRENPAFEPPPVPRGGQADDQITISVSSPADKQAVIAVGGEVDMVTSPQLRSAVLDRFAAGTELVVLDLDGVTFLGTSGLAVLIEVREAAHAAGVELRLACTARRVLRPLTIAGLVPLFDIHDTTAQALVAT